MQEKEIERQITILFIIDHFKGKVWESNQRNQANQTGYWEYEFSELNSISVYCNFFKAYELWGLDNATWGTIWIYKNTTFTFNYCKPTMYHVLF